jgi:hypothetical protein
MEHFSEFVLYYIVTKIYFYMKFLDSYFSCPFFFVDPRF